VVQKRPIITTGRCAAFCGQKKKDEKAAEAAGAAAAEKERKHLELAKESERTLLSPNKSPDLVDSDDHDACDKFWPVSNQRIFKLRIHEATGCTTRRLACCTADCIV